MREGKEPNDQILGVPGEKPSQQQQRVPSLCSENLQGAPSTGVEWGDGIMNHDAVGDISRSLHLHSLGREL